MVDEITKIGAQPAAKEAQRILKGDIEGLKQQAINFIKNINRLMEEYEHIEKLTMSPAANIAKVYSKMKKQNELASNLVKAQYNFEAQLNGFLGRSIHFVWIDNNTGKVFFQDEANAIKIYSNVSSAREGSVSIRIDPSKLAKKPEMLEDNIQKLVRRRQFAYQYVFQTALNRWDENANKNNKWHSAHYKQFYWNEGIYPKNNDWHWSYKKISRGNISQAYINMIMTQAQQMNLAMGSIETRLKYYDLYMQNHEILNAKPGIAQGDVILQFTNVEEGTVQFAVKSTGADTAKIGPYIYAAYKIIDLAQAIDKTKDPVEQIQTLLQTIPLSSGFRKNILIHSEKELRERVDKIINGNN